MPAAMLTRDQVIDKLMVVLRREGYSGASLAELSKATGLGKSSLYHYFPDGKDGMTLAVLERLAALLDAALFTPLRGPGPARKRIDALIAGVDAFYLGGREACLLGALVVGESRTRFQRELAEIFETFVDSIAAALRDGGVPRAEARTRATDAVIRIEGALILAKGTGQTAPFTRTLEDLKRSLLAPV